MSNVCKFTLHSQIDQETIEEQIATAIVTAECMFGEAKVRLNVAYLASDNKVVIDVSNKIGEHIAEVFTGLIIKRFGEKSFSVERVKKK